MDPAIGIIELKSIAKGLSVTDAVVKKATVSISASYPLSTGKYFILFSGPVAEVEESWKVGVASSSTELLNECFIPYIDETVYATAMGKTFVEGIDSLAVFESDSLASCVLFADMAVKAADIRMVKMKLGQGIGGKGYFVISGLLHEVEAAAYALSQGECGLHRLTGKEIIANPYADTIERL